MNKNKLRVVDPKKLNKMNKKNAQRRRGNKRTPSNNTNESTLKDKMVYKLSRLNDARGESLYNTLHSCSGFNELFSYRNSWMPQFELCLRINFMHFKRDLNRNRNGKMC